MSRALIIDDDPDYAEMLGLRLEKLGHEARVAPSLRQGLEAGAAWEPDVVFLDVNLPDGSGLSAIGRLAEGPSRPEVIIVTARGEPDGAELAVRGGAWDYLCKGDSPQQVVLALRRALEYREQKRSAAPRALDLAGVIGKSPAMRACFDAAAQAASSDANVLLTGESGTGKEVFARVIHRNSKRRGRSLVVVDCAALPEHLVESVLFGHRRGAFTGAVESRVGLIEQADGGILFLDEVAEMPLGLQKAFLRVLQEKRFRPVGADHEAASDFRLIAATNRDLHRRVSEGLFREDLLFRLQALAVHLPPLRDRGEDLREIAQDAVARICSREGTGTKGVSPEFFEALGCYPWPGNVRELVHAMERAVAAAVHCHTLYPKHLPTEVRVHAARQAVAPAVPEAAGALPSFEEHRRGSDRAYLQRLIAAAGGEVEAACRVSGLSRTTLYRFLKEHELPRAA